MTDLYELTDRCLLAISGPDRYDYLNNLVTQNCSSEHIQSISAGALLTPQGKLLDEFLIWHVGDEIILDCAVARGDDLVQKLTLYRLRSRVEIARRPGHPWASLERPIGPADPRHVGLGFRSLVPPEGAKETAPLAQWHRHRLSLGIAEGPSEMPPGAEFPLEFALDRTRAIDFHKGCFIGQEVTSRSYRRGSRRKAIFPAEIEEGALPAPIEKGALRAPSERTPVKDLSGRRVGDVVVTHGSLSLVLLRLDADHTSLCLDNGTPVNIRPGLVERDDPSTVSI